MKTEKETKEAPQKLPLPKPAGYLMTVEGDINDADYVTSTSIVHGDDIEKVKMWIKCLKAYTPPRKLNNGRLRYEDFSSDLEDVLEAVRNGEKPESWAKDLSLEELEAAMECEECGYAPYAPVDDGYVHSITEIEYFELLSTTPTSLF